MFLSGDPKIEHWQMKAAGKQFEGEVCDGEQHEWQVVEKIGCELKLEAVVDLCICFILPTTGDVKDIQQIPMQW